MFKWAKTLTNTRGDSLAGWQVECVLDSDGETVVDIFSDLNGTPIEAISGVANRAVTDDNGNYFFFVEDGTYSLRYYDEAGEFVRLDPSFTMYGNASLQVQNDVQTVRQLRDDTAALAAAASSPDANTQAALDAAELATDSASELLSAFGPKAVSVPAFLSNPIKRITLWNAKGHEYIVSLAGFTASTITIDVFDFDLNDQVGFFILNNPDYTNGGLNLPDFVLMESRDRVGTFPSGDPDGANFSGVQGVLEFNKGSVTETGGPIQYATLAEGQINPRNITTRFQVNNRAWPDFQEYIEVGPTRSFTTIRAALESLYDTSPLADQDTPYQLPTCARARPDYRIALVFDPGTYTGVSEHVPDYVYFVSRVRHAAIFEHEAGATRAIIEGQANTGAIGCVFRNTIAEAANGGPAGGSARYAWHADYVHIVQTPDAEGDIVRDYWNIFFDCKFIVGPNATVQAYGSGIGTQAGARFINCEFDVENGSYAGLIAAANKASATAGNIGGGVFEFDNCVDKSGRSGPTVGVQNKIATTYPSILRINNCKGFDKVSHAASGSSVLGQWIVTGNNNLTAADVISDVSGETLGLS